ncbi:hypothetical protein KW807_01585 [Candidatus Parcubacteria bacterium]|nr:hypothetical protein [Candidatus Parcubacteria bacterium]
MLTGREVKELLNSPFLKEHNRRIDQLGNAILHLSPEVKAECLQAMSDQAEKDRVRDLLYEGDCKDEEFLDQQTFEEYEELGKRLPTWFPFLSSASLEDLKDYAYALMDWRMRKTQQN